MNLEQLRALVWLRWRLSRNQWSRGGGQVNAILSGIAVVLSLALAVGGAVGGVVAGAFGLSRASPLVTMFVWDGVVLVFLLVWAGGVIAELQRAEMLDLGRLLHLPVSPRDAFLLNYAASHASFSLALVAPLSAGLVLGSLAGPGVRVLLLVPVLIGFFFMVTAWTACLRGWLATLMVNPRRRRNIIMGITMAFVLVFQLPNLVMNVWLEPRASRSRGGSPEARADRQARREGILASVDTAHCVVPFLWLPWGARALAEGRPGPAVLGALGMVGLGALGLGRAYRSAVRFHQGDAVPAGPSPARPARRVRLTRGELMEREFPGVPPSAAAVLLATFRSMSRAPEVRMALVLNVVIFGMLGVGFLVRGQWRVPAEAHAFVAGAVVGATFLGLLQVLFNQFGFDRDGFRMLVLSPVARRDILLGKNLALLPLGSGIFAGLLLLTSLLVQWTPWVVLEGCLLFGTAFLIMCVVGNAVSILLPVRMNAGSLNATKVPPLTLVLMMMVTALLPLALSPVLVPPALGLLARYAEIPWPAAVECVAALVLLGLAALGYRWSMGFLGDLLERRERAVLQAVTREVE